MMNMLELKKYIIEKSEKIGIDIIGFCSAEPFENLKELLQFRREEGHETEFEEKDVELRTNPIKTLPQAKSIITIGISYNCDDCLLEKEPRFSKGKLSKSSWGIDYHFILREKLEELVQEIRKVKDFQYKAFVDTGPLVDREVAKRAGIGWYGKNSSIINDEFGSFIFIGYIITDLEIIADNVVNNHCGSCMLCIDACPTGAIGDDNRINAKKCISYLTQTKERIPYELRDKMGVKIYGCDTCQNCCPKNKEVSGAKNESFASLITNGEIDLHELLQISNREFKERYGQISASWRGKNVLRRNSIIALGNLKDRSSIELLKNTMEDQSLMIREYSAWALLKIDRELGRKVVDEHIKKEKNRETKEEMYNLLEYFEGDKK